jgi:uroporphyrinogen-III synthase
MNKEIKIISTKLIKAILKNELLKSGIILSDYNFIETVAVDYPRLPHIIKTLPPHYIFTSSKAVELFVSLVLKHKIVIPAKAIIYCLQGETRKAVLNAGMNPLLTATSARQLAQMIHKKGLSKQLLFFCADMRRPDLPDYLSANKINVQEVVLYKTLLKPRYITHNYAAVLFFSPSAVQSFFMANKLKSRTVCFCIGSTTAETVKQNAVKNKIFIADKPSQQSLIEKVNNFFSMATQLHSVN